MRRIEINEKITKRGMNNLFYEINVYDEKNHITDTISYQRNCIANILHETPIFEFFKRMENSNWDDEQCKEYCSKLRDVIKKIEEISKIY